jgi:excisionase family DNA binding protein
MVAYSGYHGNHRTYGSNCSTRSILKGRGDEVEKLLTVGEAASALALKPSTIRRMVLERRIDVVRPVKRAVRIPASAVEARIKAGYRPAIQ